MHETAALIFSPPRFRALNRHGGDVGKRRGFLKNS
jgi:hypothetical protein